MKATDSQEGERVEAVWLSDNSHSSGQRPDRGARGNYARYLDSHGVPWRADNQHIHPSIHRPPREFKNDNIIELGIKRDFRVGFSVEMERSGTLRSMTAIEFGFDELNVRALITPDEHAAEIERP